MTLEERITRLEDIEAIRQLQARYQRSLDCRDFDSLADCFTSDAVSSYGNGSMSYRGRDEILHFLCRVMTTRMPSTHLIHGGEIDVKGTEATALWYLEDYLLHRTYLMKIHGAAIYRVTYRKTDDRWQICSIGYERCYEYMQFRGLLNLITLGKTTFLNRVAKADPAQCGPFDRYFQQHTLKKKV